MGSLKDVMIQTGEIKTTGGSFTVGPLTAGDILALFIGYRANIEQIFETFKAGGSESDVIVDLIVTVPELVGEIIARASGDASDAAMTKARRLDFGAQLLALEKVGELTVSSVGGLGNLAILIERLSGNVSTAMAQSGSLLPSGFMTSANSAPSSQEQGTPTPGATPSG